VVVTVLGALLVFYMIPVLTLVGPLYLIFRELGLYNTRTALVLTHMTINLPMTVMADVGVLSRSAEGIGGGGADRRMQQGSGFLGGGAAAAAGGPRIDR
jgi:uncharacterized membrane protein YgcG